MLKQTLTDVLEIFQVGPTAREPNYNAARADQWTFSRHLDHQRTPGAWLAFAQRVLVGGDVDSIANFFVAAGFAASKGNGCGGAGAAESCVSAIGISSLPGYAAAQ